LEQADVLIVIDAEYNHTPTPGMLNLLDHFHHGQYKHKVAGILTYSAQLTGGARSAYVLRNTLGELAMTTIPSIYMVPSVFTAIDTATHTLKDDAATLRLENWFNELEWYGNAVKSQRLKHGLPVIQDKLAPAITPAAKVAAASSKKN
jgi:chromate reductase